MLKQLQPPPKFAALRAEYAILLGNAGAVRWHKKNEKGAA